MTPTYADLIALESQLVEQPSPPEPCLILPASVRDNLTSTELKQLDSKYTIIWSDDHNYNKELT